MPKRKSSDNERINRKIRKLERKLDRQKRRLERGDTDSSSDADPQANIPLISDDPQRDEPEVESLELLETIAQDTASGIEVSQSLDDAILGALGEPIEVEKGYDAEVHEQIFRRVEKILKDGLPTTIKEQLLKSCLIPKNATLLEAPKLNPELEGILSETIKSRDKRVEERQDILGVAIGRVLKATHMLTQDDTDKLGVIKALSEASKLLSELHFKNTDLRRKLILPNLNKTLSSSLDNVKRDQFLFGEKFCDLVKTSSAMKRSAANVLKQPAAKPGSSQRTPTARIPQGNYRAPQHLRTQRGAFRGSYHQRPTAPKVQGRRQPFNQMQSKLNQRARYP